MAIRWGNSAGRPNEQFAVEECPKWSLWGVTRCESLQRLTAQGPGRPKFYNTIPDE